jgi:hypothetical protein
MTKRKRQRPKLTAAEVSRKAKKLAPKQRQAFTKYNAEANARKRGRAAERRGLRGTTSAGLPTLGKRQ